MAMNRLVIRAGWGLALLAGCAAAGSDAVKSDGRLAPGEAIFRKECAMCHGNSGTLGLSGAKDLTQSTLSKEEMIAVVTRGRGGMAGFGHLLTEEQINEVVDHVRTLHAAP